MKSNNKIKKKVSNNITYLEIKGEKNQQLDAHRVEAITKNKVEGLLPMQVQNAGKTFKLVYNITGLQSIKSYLAEVTLNKQLFGFLLQNIFNIINALDQNYFSQEGLMLTYSKVKIEPASKRLYFLYVPIQDYNCETDLKEFLKGLLTIAHFSDSEDNSYVREYISILNNGVNFSKFDLQQYINSIANNGMSQERKKKCPNCGKLISADANFCSNCHYSFISGGVTGPTKTSYYNPAEDVRKITPSENEQGFAEADSDELEWGSFDNSSSESSKGGTSVIGQSAEYDNEPVVFAPPIEDTPIVDEPVQPELIVPSFDDEPVSFGVDENEIIAPALEMDDPVPVNEEPVVVEVPEVESTPVIEEPVVVEVPEVEPTPVIEEPVVVEVPEVEPTPVIEEPVVVEVPEVEPASVIEESVVVEIPEIEPAPVVKEPIVADVSEPIHFDDEAGTTVLGVDTDYDEPPTDVVEVPKKIVKNGYLTRLSNKETRKIDKDMFTVGRSLKNDFSIPDNGAVGRSHMIFRVANGRFYIVDQNSTNKTYVNARVIAPATNVEVFDKTRIRLANEEFMFNIVVTEE